MEQLQSFGVLEFSAAPVGRQSNLSLRPTYTPSTAFRHLPPNSARFSYATEGALFISALLSTDAVSALRKVRVLISNMTVEATQPRQSTHVNMRRIHPGLKKEEEKSSVSIQPVVVLFALV